MSGIWLLDTHVWLWYLLGEDRLAKSRLLKGLLVAADHGGLRVSVISVWELGMLEAKGRIVLPCPVQEWVRRSLEGTGIVLAELTETIALESSRLPGEFHGDPADRILVATARELGATLVTCDEKILKYAAGHYVHAQPV